MVIKEGHVNQAIFRSSKRQTKFASFVAMDLPITGEGGDSIGTRMYNQCISQIVEKRSRKRKTCDVVQI